uniref:Ovule protein n=1 Tax=Rhabditophanes sp. KR3021 TaxID=114890 RepID=A0AC35THL1_9BILA
MVQRAAPTKAMTVMKQMAKNTVPRPYEIPGNFQPLPGRSHSGDYIPLFPFASQYSGGVDLDPSISRHIGGDINVPIPSWGMMDISGHFNNRIHDTTTKFGYMAHPVNMLGLDKGDMLRLMTNPSLQHNREAQPLIPLGQLPRQFAPLSCKAPMCNPFVSSFMFGVDHDYGGSDGVNGDILIPMPVSKDIKFTFFMLSLCYLWAKYKQSFTINHINNKSHIVP